MRNRSNPLTPRLAAPLVVALLAACTTARQTQPAETATEQLLISSAIDRVVGGMKPAIPPGSTVFVDGQYVDGYQAKYTISAIRDQLLKNGARLTDDRKAADTIVEVRAGAESIDQHTLLIGIPSLPIPIPLTGVVNTPEIALFKEAEQKGIAKIALTAYNARNGSFADSVGPAVGTAKATDWVVLLVVGWSTNDLLPPGAKK